MLEHYIFAKEAELLRQLTDPFRGGEAFRSPDSCREERVKKITATSGDDFCIFIWVE